MSTKASNSKKAAEKTDTAASPPAPSAKAEPTPTTTTTLRNRHDKSQGKAHGTAEAKPASTSSSQADISATDAPQHPNSHGPGRCTFLLGAAGFVAFVVMLLVCVFLGLQVVLLDDMDLQRTAARLEHAGKGREWFPVWMGNFVVDSLTAAHEGAATAGSGGSHAAAAGGSNAVPAPPPRRVTSTPAAPPSVRSTSSNSATHDATHSPSASSSSSLSCYTLEAYSETFLQLSSHKSPAAAQFSCGTRVVDLRSEDRPDVVAACAAHTIASQHAGRDHFPTLRVVLTAAEVQRHRAVQPVNTVTQRIPLSRVNDDYCDCMDGTDELLTNACSMSGPLTPAAGSRWKSYLVSNQALRLYDAPDALEMDDLESRGFPLTPRKRGDVGDRLYVSQGPVLPFVCMCGAVRQLLAPSLVGDGVVDCCGAEDEATLPSSPFVSSLPSVASNNNAVAVEKARDRLVAVEHAEMLRQWQQRQADVAAAAAAAAAQSTNASSYLDALSPHLTSARALLVDKGYYSLFTAAEVQQERQAAATIMRDVFARGHLLQRRRVQKGWERLGQGLTENRTRLQVHLANVTQELTAIERGVQEQMEAARTNNPLQAGVPIEVLQRHDELAQAYHGMQMELQHLSLTAVHHAYGDHFEYYPLVFRALSIAAGSVVDASTPPDLHPLMAQDRARRVVSPLQLEHLAREAHRSGVEAPMLHVDNVSASYFGVEVMRHTMVAQKFDAAEAPYVAQQLGLIPRGPSSSSAPFDPHVFDKITDPFLRAPILPTGSWQPFQTLRNGRVFQLADPAGDLHLVRRAGVAAASPLYRGGGRLQLPSRVPEAPRSVTVEPEGEREKSLKDKIKAAADGQTPSEKKMDIPYHFHMPHVFAVERYAGHLHCSPDPLPVSARHQRNAADDNNPKKSARMVEIFTTYVCDTKDSVLHWGRNGRCTQEVVIGTPSACTAWSLKNAREALKAVTPQTTGKVSPNKEKSADAAPAPDASLRDDEEVQDL